MKRDFEAIEKLGRSRALRLLGGSDQPARSRAIISLALHDKDWRWVQNLCLSLLDDPNPDIRASALLGLGHVARLHRRLDLERVLPRVRASSGDSRLAPRVLELLEDIEIYVRPPPGNPSV